jgi:DNA-binding protein YbaB
MLRTGAFVPIERIFMALEQGKVGTHIAEQMEAIEADYAEKEGNYEVGQILTIVEVVGPEGHTDVRIRPAVAGPQGLFGLLKLAEIQGMAMMQAQPPEE